MSLSVSSHSLTPATPSLSLSTTSPPALPSTAMVETATKALTVASGGGCGSTAVPSASCPKLRSRLVPSSSDPAKASEVIEIQREELRTEFPTLYREYPSLISKEADYTILPTLDRLASKRVSAAAAAAASGGAGSTREESKAASAIPKVLNYIWLGGQLPEKYKENIATNARIMNTSGGMTILWTDQETISKGLEKFFLDNHILVINVNDVFGNRDSMELFTYYRSALAKMPPNYGEASDLLRYEILDRFGGYYFDCDVPPSPPRAPCNYLLKDMLKHPLDPCFQIVIGSNFVRNESKEFVPVCNDCLGAMPRSSFLNTLKLAIHRRYASKMPYDIPLFHERAYVIASTTHRSGPWVLKWTCEEIIRDYRKKHPEEAGITGKELMKKYGVTESYRLNVDASWTYSSTHLPKIHFSNETERRLRIKHDLIVSLISDDLYLDLDHYLFYMNEDMTYEDKIQYMRDLVDEVMREKPHLFTQVNTIFIRDIRLYLELQEKIERHCGKKIEWKEAATLLFAAKMNANDLALYLIDHKKLDFFKCYEEENTYLYNCGSLCPIEEASLAKNSDLIQILYEKNPDPVTKFSQSITSAYVNMIDIAACRRAGGDLDWKTEESIEYFKPIVEFYREFLRKNSKT